MIWWHFAIQNPQHAKDSALIIGLLDNEETFPEVQVSDDYCTSFLCEFKLGNKMKALFGSNKKEKFVKTFLSGR